jgi:DNA-binding response OmpR family regulator
MKILVVDDNHLLCMVLVDHLRDRGHHADSALDGQSALRICEEKSYDLLVIDMVLPRLGGIDLLQRLRQQHSNIRAIIITGFPELLEEQRARVESLGVDAVIQKPFSFSDVDTVIGRPQ